MEKTGVRPERQKLLNLKVNNQFGRHDRMNNSEQFFDGQVKGKAATDSMELGELGLKQNFKLMMMGR